jgi:uncharacterized protein
MSSEFKPIAANDRIHALDVIRGLALLGIFTMNVEFFNRALGNLDLGLPADVGTIDHWAGWFVYVFVQGKFWTMFSLLFGMGFAVMLGRAEQAGRAFLGPYVRRTLALAVFGALHAILIWAGDILFSYAMGAALLMIVLYTRPKVLLLIAATCLGIATLFATLSKLMASALPWQPLVMIGITLLVLCAVAATLRRWPLSGLRNAGLALYLVPYLIMTVGGVVQMNQPPEPERDRIALAAAHTPARQDALSTKLKRRADTRQEQLVSAAEEERVMQAGSYSEAVTLRGHDFVQHVETNFSFSTIVLGMFLLGAWFIRSGAMAHPEQHLQLFRKLAGFGLPIGIGLSLLSAGIVTSRVRGVNDGAFQVAFGLMMLSNLPVCLGYISALVLLWHGRARTFLAPLAPTGRMALTNYLGQSIIGTLFFYGYGLGYWGMGRAWQLVFVVLVFALQIAFSHWSLARHRYGPMEWLWRWATYGKRPVMQVTTGKGTQPITLT